MASTGAVLWDEVAGDGDGSGSVLEDEVEEVMSGCGGWLRSQKIFTMRDMEFYLPLD